MTPLCVTHCNGCCLLFFCCCFNHFLVFFFRKWCYGIPLLWNTTSFLFFLLFAAQVGVNDKLHGNEHAKKNKTKNLSFGVAAVMTTDRVFFFVLWLSTGAA